MPALLVTLGLSLAAFGVHVMVWRIRVPARQTRALGLIFLLVASVAAALWIVARSGGHRGPLSAAALPQVGLGYAAIACCYLIVYAGVEEFSPSLVIIRALKASAGRGCTRGELADFITAERFIAPRLAALVRDGLIEGPPSGRRLTRKGRRMAQTSSLLARMFHLNVGA
jgi:hypothetical protein